MVRYLERHPESLDWITLFLVVCFVLFTVAKLLYPKRFDEFIQLPLTDKYFLVQGKIDEINHPFNLLLFAAQVFSMSLFIYLFFLIFIPETIQNEWLFLQICTAYTVFVSIKFYIEKIMGNLFSIDSLINNYLYHKLSYRNYMAIVIFLANLFFYYYVTPGKIILWIFVVTLIIFNTIALFYSYKKNATILLGNFPYFILYLCALEISPYIILYKTLV